MTRVNWAGMSPSAMTVELPSVSPPPRWELAMLLFPSALSRWRCDESSVLQVLMGVWMIWWSSCKGARRFPPSKMSWKRKRERWRMDASVVVVFKVAVQHYFGRFHKFNTGNCRVSGYFRHVMRWKMTCEDKIKVYQKYVHVCFPVARCDSKRADTCGTLKL